MGVLSSKNKTNNLTNNITTKTFNNNTLSIERMIGPGISLGVNPNGEQLKFNNKCYKLINTNKKGNKLEYTFEPDITLTFEKTNQITIYGVHMLFYKLIIGSDIRTGTNISVFNPINRSSSNLDLIASLQKIK